MSYDIYLNDPSTGEVSKVNSFLMTGGTVPCRNVNGQLFQDEQTDAWINITYNYAKYYYAVTEGDERFAHTGSASGEVDYGIRGIYGKTGAESIPLLQLMIDRIHDRYIYSDGKWLDEREADTSDYWAPTAANAIRPLRQMISLAEQCPDSVWEGD